jgi:hypothetical protein
VAWSSLGMAAYQLSNKSTSQASNLVLLYALGSKKETHNPLLFFKMQILDLPGKIK